MIDLGESDPRAIAFAILRRVERGDAWSSVLLQRMGTGLPPRDAALVTELVHGVLRHRLSLDADAARLASRPSETIDADTLTVLRLGLYQMHHLDRIPDHAIVNESVRLARRHARSGKERGVAAFVNGVLRAATRDPGRDMSGTPAPGTGDPWSHLALRESFPEWLTRRWGRRLGAETTAGLLAALNRPAPTTVRLNARLTDRAALAASLASEGIETTPGRHLDAFLRITRGAPQRSRAFDRGELYIQDEASGLVARLAGWGPGMRGRRVLDVCAAPGGKALALAEEVGDPGLVVAADLHPARLRMLRDNAARMGLTRCLPLAADLAVAPPLTADTVFDLVVVDAPCSGTGVIRRNPELRYRVSSEAIDRLTKLQARLLGTAAPLVTPGGALVYSVCSLEPEEGEEQIERFLGAHPEFRLEDPRTLLPVSAAGLVRDLHGGGGALTTRPDRGRSRRLLRGEAGASAVAGDRLHRGPVVDGEVDSHVAAGQVDVQLPDMTPAIRLQRRGEQIPPRRHAPENKAPGRVGQRPRHGRRLDDRLLGGAALLVEALERGEHLFPAPPRIVVRLEGRRCVLGGGERKVRLVLQGGGLVDERAAPLGARGARFVDPRADLIRVGNETHRNSGT